MFLEALAYCETGYFIFTKTHYFLQRMHRSCSKYEQ